MAGELSDEQRLAAVYDLLDPDRSDLDVYADMVAEFGARTVVDIGCGTGTFACMLASRGIDVIGVDPNDASLEVAQAKSGAGLVRWIHGDSSALPADTRVDLVTMTANVAQVFLTDDDWQSTLQHAFTSLRAGGRLVFETRDPARQAWGDWTREQTHACADVPGVGVVDEWIETTNVDGAFVTLGSEYLFHHDGVVLTPPGMTLRFRSRQEVLDTLHSVGFVVEGVRDAPDRPGREFVFIAQRPTD